MEDTIIFSGQSHRKLAEKICRQLNLPLASFERKEYKNGCFELIFKQDISQKKVFLIQTSLPNSCSLHKDIWELLEMINFIKNQNAKEIITVMPYISYARSDKKYEEKMGIVSELFIELLESSGMTGFIGIDFHSKKFEEFFTVKNYQLSAVSLLVKELKERNLKNIFVLPADEGAFEKASILAKNLNSKIGRVKKERISDTKVIFKEIEGNFEGKNVIIFDDEISTGGTLQKLTEEIEGKGIKSITLAVVHGLFAGEAIGNLKNIKLLKEIIITDTVPIREEIKKILPLTVLSVNNLLAEKIKALVF